MRNSLSDTAIIYLDREARIWCRPTPHTSTPLLSTLRFFWTFLHHRALHTQKLKCSPPFTLKYHPNPKLHFYVDSTRNYYSTYLTPIYETTRKIGCGAGWRGTYSWSALFSPTPLRRYAVLDSSDNRVYATGLPLRHKANADHGMGRRSHARGVDWLKLGIGQITLQHAGWRIQHCLIADHCHAGRGKLQSPATGFVLPWTHQHPGLRGVPVATYSIYLDLGTPRWKTVDDSQYHV